MVQRLTYRKRHSYATKSNQHRVVKTPGHSPFYVKQAFFFFVNDLYHSACTVVRFDPFLSRCVFCLMLEFRWEAGVSDHQEEGKRS